MFQRVRQTRTQIEAELLISRLRAAGLHPSDLRVWPHVTLAGGELFYHVEVPRDEVPAADRVIRSAADEDVGHGAPSLPWVPIRIGVALLIAALAAGMLLP